MLKIWVTFLVCPQAAKTGNWMLLGFVRFPGEPVEQIRIFFSPAESLGQADNFDVRYITVGAFKEPQSYFLAERFYPFSGRTG